MEFSDSQVDVLKKISFESYIGELTEHCGVIFPELISLNRKEDFRSCIQLGITLARKAGYTQRGPIRLYIDMMIILGMNFECDPLFHWLKTEEQKVLSQIERSIMCCGLLDDYLARVYGVNGCFFKKSLEKFKDYSVKFLPEKIGSSNAELHELLRDIYPQRYDFAGYDAVNDLITLSGVGCERYKLKRDSHKTYLILIMFLFGCSFEQDVFRGHLITEPLMKYFNNDDISGHNIIVSSYASFQVNHGSHQ